MVRFGYDPRQDPQARLLAYAHLTFHYVDWKAKLPKTIFQKPQPPDWSRLCGIATAGESHYGCFHEPLIGRTGS